MQVISFDHSALPPEEQESAHFLSHNLLQLQSSAAEFRASVDLFCYVHSLKFQGADSRKMVSWINIAGRNGAIVANGFWMGLQAINQTRAPTVWRRADMSERNQGSQLFASEFPTIAAIRNSAAHPVELSAKPNERKKHGLKEPFIGLAMNLSAGVMVSGQMNAEVGKLTYSASFNGAMVSYELCAQKADVLDQVVAHYLKTFYPLEDAQSAAHRAHMQTR